MTAQLHVAPSENDPDQTPAAVARRLVVELNRRTAEDLAWVVDREDLNKTTVVNRAVQVYRMIIEAQLHGGSVTIDDPERGTPTQVRFL